MPILPIYQYRSFDLIHMDKWDGFYGNILQSIPKVDPRR